MSLCFEIMNKDHVELAWSFSVNPEKCDYPDVFRNQLISAFADMCSGNSVTHVVIDKNDTNKVIAGFVTLRASAYLKQYPDEENFTASSAIEIQCLAVDKNYEKRGIGTALVYKAITIAYELCKKYIGVNYIVLRSNKSAISFYTRKSIGFTKLSSIGKLASEKWNEDCVPLIVKIEPENI